MNHFPEKTPPLTSTLFDQVRAISITHPEAFITTVESHGCFTLQPLPFDTQLLVVTPAGLITLDINRQHRDQVLRHLPDLAQSVVVEANLPADHTPQEFSFRSDDLPDGQIVFHLYGPQNTDINGLVDRITLASLLQKLQNQQI